MYELTTLFKDQGADNFKKRVLFLICDDARSIYNANGRGTYTEFWDNKYKELVVRKNQLGDHYKNCGDELYSHRMSFTFPQNELYSPQKWAKKEARQRTM